MDALFKDLISLAEEMIKKTDFLLSVAEILPTSNITEFEDGTNFPYKFCTIFQKMRRELNKIYVQTLRDENEEWIAEIARLKSTQEHMKKKRAMKDEGESSNKKMKGNIE